MHHMEEEGILDILEDFVSTGLVANLEASSGSLKETRLSEGMLLELLPVVVPPLRC